MTERSAAWSASWWVLPKVSEIVLPSGRPVGPVEMARSGLIGLDTAAAVIASAAVRAGLGRREAESTARSGVRAGAGVANV
jgi:hypothetical protein